MYNDVWDSIYFVGKYKGSCKFCPSLPNETADSLQNLTVSKFNISVYQISQLRKSSLR